MFRVRDALNLARIATCRGRLQRLAAASLCVAVLAFPAARMQAQDRGLAATSSSISATTTGKYYALVIGVDQYSGSLVPLRTAVHDAQSVAQLLQSQFGFQVTLLLDHQATRGNILDTLNDELRSKLAPDDSLLIYYAGHGYYDSDADKAYWLPSDAASVLSANSVSADDLTTAIRALAARHVLIVSDSCYSGDLTRGSDEVTTSKGEEAYLNRMQHAPSRTLMSSGSDEPVADNGPDGHSIFAAALLHVLGDDAEPAFIAADIIGPVQNIVRTRSAQIPRYYQIGNALRRTTSVEVGDFVFHRTAPPAPPVAAPRRTVSRGEADAAYASGMSLWRQYRRSDALPLLETACDGDVLHACRLAGDLLSSGAQGITQDAARGAQMLNRACAAGDMDACGDMASSYDGGVGVPHDPAQALALAERACDADAFMGCVELGYFRRYGRNGDRDLAQADVFYHKADQLASKACDGNDVFGCAMLGFAYLDGHGVTADTRRALGLLRKACDGGVAEGCTGLGDAFIVGKQITAEPATAAANFRKGCDGGDPEGCSDLAALYYAGKGVDKDLPKALELARRGCAGGDPSGCTTLGGLYQEGSAEPGKTKAENESKAAEFYRRGCDGGDPSGCNQLGGMYFYGMGVGMDQDRALTLFRSACDDDDAGGCRSLGGLYLQGSGVARDTAKAAGFFRKGCEAGDGDACIQLGSLYYKGNGVAEDGKLAARYWNMACEKGLLTGCDSVAGLYAEGKDVKRDNTAAETLYSKTCANNDAYGCGALGAMLAFSEGVTHDDARALTLLQKGCDGNDAYSCLNLGVMYEGGHGTPDRSKAAAAYQKACDLGDQRACDRRRALGSGG